MIERFLVFAVLPLLYSTATALEIDTSIIKVVYPKYGARVGAVDSTFIFGSVPPGWDVTVNGEAPDLDPGGGWLAFLPLSSGEFVFKIQAFSDSGRASLDWRVTVPEAPQPDSFVAPYIYEDYRLPDVPVSYNAGEILRIQMRAVPGCRAWAEIPGFADSIALSESEGIPAPFYRASVWEDGERDAPRILGIYQGLFELRSAVRADSLAVIYHLSHSNFADAVTYLRHRSVNAIEFDALKALQWEVDPDVAETTSDTGEALLSFNPEGYPRTVEFTDTTQIIRVGPRRGYLGLFQPEGVRALAVGYENGWYRIRLSESRVGYVFNESVKLLDAGILPPQSRLTSFRSQYDTTGRVDKLHIDALLSGKHVFSVTEPTPRTVVLELFGVMMDTDWFRYDFKDPHIENALWAQPEPGLFRLELRFKEPIWGYRTGYQNSVFRLSIHYPPAPVHELRGKRIVVDPGHSRDPGSIGPTGFTEAEANLGIALRLRDELARRGAIVTLTREDSSHVELYDRPKIADSVDADLFVSVHNNALPDGANPFVNWGVSTYHYHTHSIALARAIHAKMLDLPNQRDHGFYHGNLAVCRPTERPSALVECGFMILPEQEAWLKTDFYRSRVAKAIAQGIENFFKEFGRNEE